MLCFDSKILKCKNTDIGVFRPVLSSVSVFDAITINSLQRHSCLREIAMSSSKQFTIPKQSRPPRPRVAEIRVPQPHWATLGREQFESIADDSLFPDTRRLSCLPALTLRLLLEPNGPTRSPRRRVRFGAGLVERVTAMLQARGWRVIVRPDQRVEYWSHHFSPDYGGWCCPEPLRRAYGRPRTLALIPKPADRLQYVVSLREQFPNEHILIATKNTEEAKTLARKLRQQIGQPVTSGPEYPGSDPATHVDRAGTFAWRPALDWTFVVFWDAELLPSLTSIRQLGHMCGSVRIGFLSRDERQLNVMDRAAIEYMFGPVIYRPGDDSSGTAVRVAWLPAPAYPASRSSNQLERKRENLWHNGDRNGSIANTALAFSSKDEKGLTRLGLGDAANWLGASTASSPPFVAIVVENLEHARELQRLLPAWRLVSGTENIPEIDQYLPSENVIVTLPRTEQIILATEIVIYGAGIGNDWIDNLGPHNWFTCGERMLVIDVADDFDPKAVRETEARRADYHRRGWATNTLYDPCCS